MAMIARTTVVSKPAAARRTPARRAAVADRAAAGAEKEQQKQQQPAQLARAVLASAVASAFVFGAGLAAPDDAFAAARSGGRVSANGFAKRRAGWVGRLCSRVRAWSRGRGPIPPTLAPAAFWGVDRADWEHWVPMYTM